MKKTLSLLLLLLCLTLAACGKAPPAAETDPPGEPVWWEEALPWSEDWTCLLLDAFELDPETGKAGLRALLASARWTVADPASERGEKEYSPQRGFIYLPEGDSLALYLFPEGELYLNGTLYRAQDGEAFLAAWSALAETCVDTQSPPELTLSCGENALPAILYGSYAWNHVTRSGGHIHCDSDGFTMPYSRWLDSGDPVLYAEGEVCLDFALRPPEDCSLYVCSELGQFPVELREGRFTPYAGVNVYALSCTWEEPEQGGYGSCQYILLIEGAETNAPEVTEIPELRLRIDSADAWGCVFTLEDLGDRDLSGSSPYTLLRRTAAGGWEWVLPRRDDMMGFSVRVAAGGARTGAWDWSYACGPLPAGEYCLQLRGFLGPAHLAETVFFRACFTLGAEEAEGPGPLTLCPLPEGIEGTLEALSPHRWVQTLAFPEAGWKADGDYALYRLLSDGALEYIPPKYHLPESLNVYLPRKAGQAASFDADLAAAYGELPAGDYVLRRRFLRLTEEELRDTHSPAYDFRDWRLAPADRVQYGDMAFTLASPLSAVSREIEPWDGWFYAGQDMAEGVSALGSWFGSSQVHLRLELSADAGFDLQYPESEYALYVLDGGEWFPMARLVHPNYGINRPVLKPGEVLERDFYLARVYGKLEPGTYRLVIPCIALPRKEGQERHGGFLAVQFRIREDLTGVWEGPELEALREVYPRASGYFMSENTLLGKSLKEYIARMMGPEHPESDSFYAEVEYLGKGMPSESYLRDSIRVKVLKIVCGELEALPERVLEEDGSVLLAVNMGVERDALPEFREGERYLVLLCCWQEGEEPWKEYANCLELCGGGEIYYIVDGKYILSTLYYREKYDGYSLESFEEDLLMYYYQAWEE